MRRFEAGEHSTNHGRLGAAPGPECCHRWHLDLCERVSRVVLPIAFLWINEHKDQICNNEDWDKLPDDVNRVVNAAFDLAKEQHYYKEGRIAFFEFQQGLRDGTFKVDDINRSWVEISKILRAKIREQFHIPGRADKAGPMAA